MTDTSDIGFVILSHDAPDRLLRLTTVLGDIYPTSPIVIHHDLSKCPIPFCKHGLQVSFVPSPLVTAWGTMSLVDAVILAMRHLFLRASPEWIIFITGSDYPAKPAHVVVDELRRSRYDAYVSHHYVAPFGSLWGGSPNQREFYQRYYGRYLHIPFVSRKGIPYMRKTSLRIPFGGHPFRRGFNCYAGDFWVTLSRKAAEHLLDFRRADVSLAPYLGNRVVLAEECYFNTVFGNASDFNVYNGCKRYIDWSAGGKHPKILTIDDLSSITSSDAHFARKMPADTTDPLFPALDAYVYGQS